MNADNIKSFDWKFWFQWVMANGLGWSIAGLGIRFEIARPLCFLPVVGIAQWYILGRCLPKISWWIVMTIIGQVVAGGVLSVLLLNDLVSFNSLLTGAVTGAAMGAMQWILLQHRVHQSSWWIIVNIAALSISSAISWNLPVVIGSVLGSIFFGATTGFVLIWLLQNPKENTEAPGQS